MMQAEPFRIICGDALTELRKLPSESVHCCVTSPPYWGLRDYGVVGQIGLEKTPADYVARLLEVFRQVKRVLRSDGTLWLNLGDSYATGGGAVGRCPGGGEQGERFLRQGHINTQPNRMPLGGFKPKDLIGIPWRVAFALQADGWWLRSDIIWSKPNPMPESVTDRPTKAHEYVFLLAKSERYFYDADAIAEAAIEGMDLGLLRSRMVSTSDKIAWHAESIKKRQSEGLDSRHAGDGTRNKRSVWILATLPTPEAHFATFPIELPETCLKAGSPEDGLVLDPFAGAGTVGLACLKNNRRFLGIELNPDYVAIAYNRARRHYPLFAPALDFTPAPEPAAEQATLLEDA